MMTDYSWINDIEISFADVAGVLMLQTTVLLSALYLLYKL